MSGFILFHVPSFRALLDKALKDFADTNDHPFCDDMRDVRNAVSLEHIENCDCDVCTNRPVDLSWYRIVIFEITVCHTIVLFFTFASNDFVFRVESRMKSNHAKNSRKISTICFISDCSISSPTPSSTRHKHIAEVKLPRRAEFV